MSFKDKAKETAENLVEKAEARSENIEGKIKERMGKMHDDEEMIEGGREKQELAADLREDANS
jgi:uncharacterized protein YjbJ (UPF0337 family)